MKTGERYALPEAVGLALLLALGIAAVFWRSAGYPFVQDDWGVLSAIVQGEPGAYLRQGLSPGGDVLYRPGGVLYFLAAHRLYGLNPVPYHLTALVLHLVTCLAFVSIVRRITGGRFTAWTVGVLYGTAATVHLDPLHWCVGIYDIAGVLFFSVAILFFLKRRLLLSAAALLLAVSFKESTISLVLLLPLYVLLFEEKSGRWLARAGRTLRALWLHGLVLSLYVLIKARAPSPLALPEAHPYKMEVFGLHVAKNAVRYLVWGVGTIVPVEAMERGVSGEALSPRSVPLLLTLCGLALFLLAGLGTAVFCRRRRPEARGGVSDRMRVLIFWGAWVLVAIGPFLLLPNHSYRYYLIYALPAGLAVAVTLLTRLLGRWSGRRRLAQLTVAVVVAANLCSSAWFLHRLESEGMDGAVLGGTNDLVRRAATVRMVRASLGELRPVLPEGAVLLFRGIDVWSFDKDAGPRLWYADRSLVVYEERYLRIEKDGAVIEGSPETQVEAYQGAGGSGRLVLDPGRTFIYRFEGGRLYEYRLTDARR